MFRAAARIVDVRHGLRDAVERIVAQVALRAAGFLAQHPHHFELVEQVARRLVHLQHAIDNTVAARLRGQRQAFHLRPQSEVVGEGQRVHAGAQRRLVGHALHPPAVHIDDGVQAAKRFAIRLAGHQRGAGGWQGGRGDWAFHVPVSFIVINLLNTVQYLNTVQ